MSSGALVKHPARLSRSSRGKGKVGSRYLHTNHKDTEGALAVLPHAYDVESKLQGSVTK